MSHRTPQGEVNLFHLWMPPGTPLLPVLSALHRAGLICMVILESSWRGQGGAPPVCAWTHSSSVSYSRWHLLFRKNPSGNNQQQVSSWPTIELSGQVTVQSEGVKLPIKQYSNFSLAFVQLRQDNAFREQGQTFSVTGFLLQQLSSYLGRKDVQFSSCGSQTWRICNLFTPLKMRPII